MVYTPWLRLVVFRLENAGCVLLETNRFTGMIKNKSGEFSCGLKSCPIVSGQLLDRCTARLGDGASIHDTLQLLLSLVGLLAVGLHMV